MATNKAAVFKREKAGGWEFRISHPLLAGGRKYRRFRTEQEGDEVVIKWVKLLNAGRIPPSLDGDVRPPPVTALGAYIRTYLDEGSPATEDRAWLERLLSKYKWGNVPLAEANSRTWIEETMIRTFQANTLVPGSIRHYVGALARCFDWGHNRYDELVVNAARTLPKGYSQYSDRTMRALKEKGSRAPKDESRWRRVSEEEEAVIRSVLAGEKPQGRERAFELAEKDALNLMFDVALETAMRMRESYTLPVEQVDLRQLTIFLEKTKNGDKRQIPISERLERLLREYMARPGFKGYKTPAGTLLFPWWSGKLDESDRDAYNRGELRRVTSLLSHQFGRITAACGIEDLNWHDLRHEAISRLFETTSLSDLEIALIIGIRNPRILARYANLRGSSPATKMRELHRARAERMRRSQHHE